MLGVGWGESEDSALPAQWCCHPKTALRNKLIETEVFRVQGSVSRLHPTAPVIHTMAPPRPRKGDPLAQPQAQGAALVISSPSVALDR